MNKRPKIKSKNKSIDPNIESLQQVTRIVAASAEALGLLGFFAGNSASKVMRFTQILKVYNRLKYIGVIFGERLESYLGTIGNFFKDSEENPLEINKIIVSEKGYNGKISRFNVFPSPFPVQGFRVYLYLLAFIFKAFANIYSNSLTFENQTEKSVVTKIRICWILRHVHFVVFNMILVDGIFFATRTIAHMNIDSNFNILTHIISYCMIAFIIVDILENLQVGNQLSDQNNQFH